MHLTLGAKKTVLREAAVVRIIEFDAIKSAAIFLIAIVHVAGTGFAPAGPNWLPSIFWMSLGKCGVPLFMLTSGALLLPRETNPREIARRAWRVLLPLFAWSFIYLEFDSFHGGPGPSIGWLGLVLQHGVAGHLWYLYMLVGAYLAMPLLVAFHKAASRENKIFILIVWFLGASVVATLTGATGLGTPFNFSFVPIYAGYFVLGAFLSEMPESNAALKAGLVMWIAGWATTFFGEWSMSGAQPNELFGLYTSPTVIMSGTGLFLVLRNIGAKISQSSPGRLHEGMIAVSLASFGMYLSHLLILDVILFQGLPANLGMRWAGYPLMTFIVLALSFVLVSVIQRVPWVRAICPR